MRRRWIRNEPDAREDALAGLLALGAAAVVGAAAFYLARLFVARDEVRPLESPALEGEVPGRARRRLAAPDAATGRGRRSGKGTGADVEGGPGARS